MALAFEWDREKARRNRAKHGVSFDEALTAFADPLGRIFDDPAHAPEETREILVAHSARRRLLVISFAERGDSVRIISARRATKNERHDYEEAQR